MRALADASQRRREYRVAFAAQDVSDATPAPTAVPGTVNENERVRHRRFP
jgi:hypothetical protein